MYNLKFNLCGKNIQASVIYETTVDYCSDYISEFDLPDLSVMISPIDIAEEQRKFDREREVEGFPPAKADKKELERLSLYRKIAEELINHNIILFHGSAVCVDGTAYLFTAKSGTGKSTHTRLWREHFGSRAVMINDDKPMLEISDDGVTIYGTPWNGKHRLGTNMKAPLKSICILERAEKNSIVKGDAKTEFAKILSQTYRNNNADFMKKTLMLLDKMLKKVEIYKLGCNMDPEAAMVSYNGMKGNNDEA